jgi:hypothetical protein
VVVEGIIAAPIPPPGNFSGQYRLGTVYQIKTAGSALGLRMWHVAGNASTGRPLYLYDDTTGALLGTANIVEQPAVSEWCQANFAAPVPLAYNQYVVACFDETSFYGRVDPPGPTVVNADHAVYVIGRYGTYQVPAKPDGNQDGYAYYVDPIMEFLAVPEWMNSAGAPPGAANGDYIFGTEWLVVTAGVAQAIRFYRSPGSVQTSRVLRLFDAANGNLLGSATTVETSGGYVEAAFATPIPLAAGMHVVCSYGDPITYRYSVEQPPAINTNPAHAMYWQGRYGIGSGTTTMPENQQPNVSYASDLLMLYGTAAAGTQASAVPVVFANGLPFNEDGQLCVDPVADPASYANGLAFSDIGALLIDSVAPVANHVHGWPVTNIGKVCQTGIAARAAVVPPVEVIAPPIVVPPLVEVAPLPIIPPEPEPEPQSIQTWWQGVKIAARRLWGRLTEWVDPVLTWRVW